MEFGQTDLGGESDSLKSTMQTPYDNPDSLRAKEKDFQEADYIGPVRSRRMMNAVVSSVLEYLSG